MKLARKRGPRRLQRRKKDGKPFGAFHCYVSGRLVNLQTDDEQLAQVRADQAVRGQRSWPRKMSKEAHRAPALRALAELGTAASSPAAPPVAPVVALVPAPPPDPPPPDPPAREVIDPEPIPAAPAAAAAGWADDVNQAAGSSTPAADSAPDAKKASEPLRFADLPWFNGALVTASKLAVAAQVKIQAVCIRWIGDAEAGRVGPPPVRDTGEPETFAAFQKKLATPWEGDDPRELGRQVYEGFLRRICPEELPIPDYLLAPVLVAICTLPVQIGGATKINKDASPAAAAPEAAPHAQAAA